jgi:hypothetical protein
VRAHQSRIGLDSELKRNVMRHKGYG